jgi:hypothetical protein
MRYVIRLLGPEKLGLRRGDRKPFLAKGFSFLRRLLPESAIYTSAFAFFFCGFCNSVQYAQAASLETVAGGLSDAADAVAETPELRLSTSNSLILRLKLSFSLFKASSSSRCARSSSYLAVGDARTPWASPSPAAPDCCEVIDGRWL